MRTWFSVLSLALLLPACNGGRVEVQLFDINSEDNLEGLTVITDTDEGTTNRVGKVRLDVAKTGGYAITVEDPEGARPVHTIFQNGYEQSYYVGHGVLTNADAERIATGVGGTLDPSLGILVVSAVWLEDNNDINEMIGVSVDLDAPYDIAVVEDPAAEAGWISGTTVPAGASYATVAFGNVTPGDVRVMVTTPEAVDTCGAWPSIDEDSWGHAVPVRAGEISSYTMLCTRADAARAVPDGLGSTDRPWRRLGVEAHVADAGSTADTLRLAGEIGLPGGPTRAAARLEVAAAPAPAPTRIDLTIASGARRLGVGIDTEGAQVSLDVGGEPIRLAHNPDGTFTLDAAVYAGPTALLNALTTDPRLAEVGDEAYVAWMVALEEVRAAAPTRFVTPVGVPNTLTSTTLPGRLACSRLGEQSSACQLLAALGSRR